LIQSAGINHFTKNSATMASSRNNRKSRISTLRAYPDSEISSSSSSAYCSAPHEEYTEEEIWNDPNLLNNPAKLMSIKWTQKDLELATSKEFVKKLNFANEFVLQGSTRLQKVLDNPRRTPIRQTEAAAVATLDGIIDRLYGEQAKCIQIYSACKGRPFWVPVMQNALTCKKQQEKVRDRWTASVEKLAAIFERVQEVQKRNGITLEFPEEDPEAEILIVQLQNVYKEISEISAVLDAVSKPAKSTK
jgi:hypothetical protein